MMHTASLKGVRVAHNSIRRVQIGAMASQCTVTVGHDSDLDLNCKNLNAAGLVASRNVNLASAFRSRFELGLPGTTRKKSSLAAAQENGANCKSESLVGDFPGIGPQDAIQTLMAAGGPTQMRQLVLNLNREFGERVRFEMPGGQPPGVYLYHPDDMMAVHRAAGPMPAGPLERLWPFAKVWEAAAPGSDKPFAVANGKEWQKERRILQKKLLSPVDADAYAPVISAVSNAAADAALKLVPREGIENFLNRCTLELIGSVMLNQRMGAISVDSRKDSDDEQIGFITAVTSINDQAAALMYSPDGLKKLANKDQEWTQFVNDFFLITSQGKQLVQSTMSAMNAGTLERIDPGIKGYLEHQLEMGQMSPEKIALNLGTLLIAGVDTTAKSILFILTHLAENPQVQQKLYTELSSVLGPDGNYARASAKNMPFLKAVIRESHRLTPTTAIASRLVTEGPVELPARQSYKAQTIFPGTMAYFTSVGKSMDPQVFHEPQQFLPERWLDQKKGSLANDKGLRNHQLMAHPFSFGPRSCLGARIASLEIRALVTSLVLKYELKCSGQWTVGNLLLSTAFPQWPKFTLTPRSTIEE